MSASGKSSNRHYEYHRGYSTGGGHGIYAAQGARDREYELRERQPPSCRVVMAAGSWWCHTHRNRVTTREGCER